MAIKYLTRLTAHLIANGVAVVGVDSDGLVSPSNLQSAADPIIAAFDDSDAAQLAWENLQARTTAQAQLDTDKSAALKISRAVAALTIDEINTLRQWLVSFKTEVAAATNLADLKTRVATLPNTPDRTLAQAVTAIKNKIDAGTVE